MLASRQEGAISFSIGCIAVINGEESTNEGADLLTQTRVLHHSFSLLCVVLDKSSLLFFLFELLPVFGLLDGVDLAVRFYAQVTTLFGLVTHCRRLRDGLYWGVWLFLLL